MTAAPKANPKASSAAQTKTRTTARKTTAPRSRSTTAKARPRVSAKAETGPGAGRGKTTVRRKTSAVAAKSELKTNDEQAIQEFRKLVNVSSDQLTRWLETSESRKVGFRDEKKGEPQGHESGRRILKIMGKRRDRFTPEDLKHIHVVVGYIKRHLDKKPKGDITASNWRYALMNWGHDPAK